MKLLVQKFGGTSVGDTNKIKNIAQRIAERKKEGNNTVVVVSAMGKTTDHLVDLSKEISKNPCKREMDMLMATGEQVTIALLSMALKELGVESISLTGFQAGIKTTGMHTKNKIEDIEIDIIQDHLKERKVVVVAGFQGINENGDITTLGRGGSDTSAVALAAKLKCPCEIYTDVDGVYTVDPRVFPEAIKLEEISYQEMMEMSSLGAAVLETRAVEIAYKYDVPLYLANSNGRTEGTRIMEGKELMEKKAITGLTITNDIVMITINNVSYTSGNIAAIFEKMAQKNINIDMISQTSPHRGITNISFTAPISDEGIISEAVRELKKKIRDIEVDLETDISKISVVGIGMMNQSGVAARVFRVFSDNGIEFKQVTTSEISISYTIDKKLCRIAVEKLARELELGF